MPDSNKVEPKANKVKKSKEEKETGKLEKAENLAPFSPLPQEVIVAIFSWLSPRDLANLLSVSKFVNRLIKDDSLWRRYTRESHPFFHRLRHQKALIKIAKPYHIISFFEMLR